MAFYGKQGLNVKKTALTVGSFAALVHLVWVVVVALGLGDALARWKMDLHFFHVTYVVKPFEPVTAITLIVLAFVGGAIAGAVLATLWNNMPE